MAQQSVSSCVDVYWVDSADKINANFTELYAKPGAATTASAATAGTYTAGKFLIEIFGY